jgi:hypothetical protein
MPATSRSDTLFVSNSGSPGITSRIGEYTTSGATVNASLINTGFNFAYGIAVSGSNLFVVESSANTIGEYTTSGATVNASLITGLGNPEASPYRDLIYLSRIMSAVLPAARSANTPPQGRR